MAYLTRLAPNLRSRVVREALNDPYQMHRDLMAAFGDAPSGEPGRRHFGVLHRIDLFNDPAIHPQRANILVLSAAKPNWTRLREGSGGQPWAQSHDMKVFDPVPTWFNTASMLRFRLRASPSRRLRRRSADVSGKPVDARWVGKRVDIREPEEQVRWLARQGARHGFHLVEIRALPERSTPVFGVFERPEGKSVARKRFKEGQVITITHAAVLFEGLLRVSDPQLFVTALLNGIGPAKAFGFGLLSIAPVR